MINIIIVYIYPVVSVTHGLQHKVLVSDTFPHPGIGVAVDTTRNVHFPVLKVVQVRLQSLKTSLSCYCAVIDYIVGTSVYDHWAVVDRLCVILEEINCLADITTNMHVLDLSGRLPCDIISVYVARHRVSDQSDFVFNLLGMVGDPLGALVRFPSLMPLLLPIACSCWKTRFRVAGISLLHTKFIPLMFLPLLLFPGFLVRWRT